jgi:omega-amidase
MALCRGSSVSIRHYVAIVSGVSEREGESIYNSQVFVDDHGKVVSKYRKLHLFANAPIEEDKCFSSGNEFTTVTFAGRCFGLSIRYDLRFPELYRKLAVENNVNTFIVSSAWPFPRVEHFRTLAMARAIENQSYVIVANRVGTDDGVSFCGASTIIDPYGVVIASASQDREELIQAEILEDAVKSVRTQMEVFAHRRPDVYR